MEIMSKCPWLFAVILIYLACLLFLCLLRAVKGPSIADRLMAVNMMGTMVMVIISILALYLQEGYLVYTGVYLERKEQEQNREEVTEEKEEKEHGNS